MSGAFAVVAAVGMDDRLTVDALLAQPDARRALRPGAEQLASIASACRFIAVESGL